MYLGELVVGKYACLREKQLTELCQSSKGDYDENLSHIESLPYRQISQKCLVTDGLSIHFFLWINTLVWEYENANEN